MIEPMSYHTKRSDVLWWNERWEAIVQSYPQEKQQEVLEDLLNWRNLEKYGIKFLSSNCFLCSSSVDVTGVDNE